MLTTPAKNATWRPGNLVAEPVEQRPVPNIDAAPSRPAERRPGETTRWPEYGTDRRRSSVHQAQRVGRFIRPARRRAASRAPSRLTHRRNQISPTRTVAIPEHGLGSMLPPLDAVRHSDHRQRLPVQKRLQPVRKQRQRHDGRTIRSIPVISVLKRAPTTSDQRDVHQHRHGGCERHRRGDRDHEAQHATTLAGAGSATCRGRSNGGTKPAKTISGIIRGTSWRYAATVRAYQNA